MQQIQVVATRKAPDGDIITLCHFGGRTSKADAIRNIEAGTHQYYVLTRDGQMTTIHVVARPSGKYLRTDKDSSFDNNLDALPDC